MLSRNKVLHQLGLDILEGLSDSDLQNLPNTIVIVGCHHSFSHSLIRVLARKSNFVVAIQTEQFFDANQRPLWGSPTSKNATDTLLQNLRFVDTLLDISENNKKWYEDLGLSQSELKKLHFGPFVFPTEKRSISSASKGKHIFFGNLNERRRQFLNKLGDGKIAIVQDGTYGDRLADELAKSKGVLNLHYSEGVYTEVPRLLTAYLSRKPVVSEKLATPFVAGVHYIDVNEKWADIDRHVYDNFSDLVTKQFSFAAFLRAAVRENRRRSSFYI